jgi:hypothetical protein
MTPVALEHERFARADRLLQDIARRHGVPTSQAEGIPADAIDRFLVAYVPENRPDEPALHEIAYAFTPSMTDALELLRRVMQESAEGEGAAAYVHDLDTGLH